MFTAPNNRVSQRNHSASATPDANAVRQALAVLSRAMHPVPAHAPVALQSTHQTAPDNNAKDLAAWARIERCAVWLIDPKVCPVNLPLRAQSGYATLLSGKPAKRFVAEGFTSGLGKTVEALVVVDQYTGDPRVVYAHGSPVGNFKIVG